MDIRIIFFIKFVEKLVIGGQNHHHFEDDHASFKYEAVLGFSKEN